MDSLRSEVIMNLISIALLSFSLGSQDSTPRPFWNFETNLVHPVRVSADGERLFCVNPPEGALEIYSLSDADKPVLMRSLPVGLEPCSVTERNADEIWVVDSLSDSVSVVSLSEGRVVDVLEVGDEPADVCFAGSPERAFITSSASDEVYVFDASTRVLVGVVPIFGKDPRALAASSDGGSVWVAVQRSGNGTTIIGEADAPAPPAPWDPSLPAAPQSGLIVSDDDPSWSHIVTWDVVDTDLVRIDAGTLNILEEIAGVGTILYDLVVDPADGHVFVAATEARNLLRFVQNLKAHSIQSRISEVTPGLASVEVHDLNPGVDNSTLPNNAARATALAEPVALVLDAANDRIFVAAQGTDRVGVLDRDGARLGLIELGASGASIDTGAIRGPRGLALHPTEPRLYVYERFAHALAVVNTQSLSVIAEVPLEHDPTPASISLGRRFHYDAKRSGNGTMSCAACHIDGDIDLLAWDLGDPEGEVVPAVGSTTFPFDLVAVEDHHPMKGPMTTQALRGLGGVAPYHWRGEKKELVDFNEAFGANGILAGDELSRAELAVFVEWLESGTYPPNPNQTLERGLKNTPPNANAAAGEDAFFADVIDTTPLFGFNVEISCAACHTFETGNFTGTNGEVVGGDVLEESQAQKVAHLRNVYRRTGFDQSAAEVKAGFGFIHDGSVATVMDFLGLNAFSFWPENKMDDIAEFMLAFDTGTAPSLGIRVLVDSSRFAGSALVQDIALLESRAAAGDIDLVLRGLFDGVERACLYQPSTGMYLPDRALDAAVDRQWLLDQAQVGALKGCFMGVSPGEGLRFARDRDSDGVLDGDELVSSYEAGVGPCDAGLSLTANSAPELGNEGFALVIEGGTPGMSGFLAVAPGVSLGSGPIAAASIQRDSIFSQVNFQFDSRGAAVVPVPLPTSQSYLGRSYDLRAFSRESCGDAGHVGSNGVHVTVMP